MQCSPPSPAALEMEQGKCEPRNAGGLYKVEKARKGILPLELPGKEPSMAYNLVLAQ